MKRGLILLTVVLVISISITLIFSRGCRSEVARSMGMADNTPYVNFQKLQERGKDAEQFVKEKKWDTSFCLLADMSMHSGTKRLFVWDFERDTFAQAFLVAHGCGNSAWSLDFSRQEPVFSNVDGSHCSSLGKYQIGERGYSQWGIHVKYLLHGLDKTNSNALKRYIVLHSWDAMTDEELFPAGSAESWGCPAVSNNAMEIIDSMLKKTDKPVLLWMYAGTSQQR